MNRWMFSSWPMLLPGAVVLAAGAGAVRARAAETGADLVLACRADNDLCRVLAVGGKAVRRYDTAAEAVKQAREGGGVLILADGYPDKTTDLDPGLLDVAAGKKLRLYVEYASSLPGLKIDKPRGTQWERAVVASDLFGPTLGKLRILALHDCHFTPVQADRPHIVVARVAGFETAVFGLPKKAFPVLFEHPRGDVLVATTKLSQFVSARYAPTAAWKTIWGTILKWVCRGRAVPDVAWTPTVRPSYRSDEALPPDVERQAVVRGVAWFKNARLLVHPSWAAKAAKWRKDHPDGVGPAPPTDWLCGDGTAGLLEGYSSSVYHDGTQPIRWCLRNDCTGESAMGFAFGGAFSQDAFYKKVAKNLNDFIYFRSVFAKGPRGDPKSPTYGLLSWSANPPADGIYYGDDNARSMLGTMACASLLGSDRWDEGLLRCLLANLRTCGRHGFRSGRLDERGLQANGWRHYFGAGTVNYAPHYEAYLWACYLWAYRHTGYELFLERARSAIRMTMAAYPDKWRWTNGILQERARMLLPLAWLVRAEDTPEHRDWLRRMAKELLAQQAPCGALREELGGAGRGSYGPPRSNEDYGKHEATLMQANGDPLCDLLYTTNFAFIGLHEAAVATGDRLYIDAEERLAKFLCRIQVRSDGHRELDGAWFRAFDFKRWEYWGSNADAGWGVWSIETGWTQGWIVSVLAMRQLKTSLWDVTSDSKIGKHMARMRPMMIPDDAVPKPKPPIKHAALGRPVKLATPCDPRYPGMGDGPLTDGLRAGGDHTDPHWLGFEGPDLDATVDLGQVMAIQSISSGYLQSTPVGVYLPTRVAYAVSADGKQFRVVADVANEVSTKQAGPLIQAFAAKIPSVQARYVRVRAKNIGTIPPGHHAAGRKAWLFVDEIIVEKGTGR